MFGVDEQGVDGKEKFKAWRQGDSWEGKAEDMEKKKGLLMKWLPMGGIMPEAEKMLNKYLHG